MDVKNVLKNYRHNQLKINIAEKQQKMTEELEKIKQEMETISMAIEYIKADYQIAIEEHFKQGTSYELLARKLGYSKNAIVYRIDCAIKQLEKLVN